MKPKYKKQNFVIDVVIYPFEVMISLNESYDEFAKNVLTRWDGLMIDKFKRDETINWGGLTVIWTQLNRRVVLIKIEQFTKNAYCYSGLIHEISHATEFILRKCGLTLNKNSHEAYAYLTGYLTKEAFKKIKP